MGEYRGLTDDHPVTRRPRDVTIAPFEPSRADLVALIDWLAMTYAGDPVFALGNEQISDHKARLQNTWRHVVGEKGPPLKGEWFPCVTCAGVGWLLVGPPWIPSDLELDLRRLFEYLAEIDEGERPPHTLWDRVIAWLPALREKWLSPQAQEIPREAFLSR